jgi:large subunit ribosomal protein L4
MLVNIYNQKGKEISQTRLPKEIFGVALNEDLVHQVVISQMANRRQVIAHTKNRGEVRGGGRKPWRQKGTGRARHGSIRSPIWRGGGVTFGPRKERVFKKRIPQKMRRNALLQVLSAKAKNNLLVVLDKLKLEKIKTKEMAEIIKGLKIGGEGLKGKSVLIALPEMDKDIIIAARNIPEIATIQAKDLNCLDLLSFKYLLLPKNSLKVIKDTVLSRRV